MLSLDHVEFENMHMEVANSPIKNVVWVFSKRWGLKIWEIYVNNKSACKEHEEIDN